MGDEDTEICISGIQLCQYLAAAESKVRRAQSLGRHSFAHEVKKRKRSETPPEEIRSGDEARYIEQEKRAVKRTADHDNDYNDTSSDR
jgi:ribosomal protein L35